MSIRTTVTLDEDVLAAVKQESRSRGASFRDTLNELLRLGILQKEKRAHVSRLKITPFHMGLREGLSLDNTEALLTYAEGEDHR